MKDTPQISVIIPVYNCAPYLEQAVESILSQSCSHLEIIAVNDGSTDESPAILQNFQKQDPRFKVVDQSNQGIVAALNTALEHSTAPFIARMDGDDIAHPNRFEKQLAFLNENPEYCACGAHVYYIDTDGKRVKSCPRPLDHASIEERLYSHGDGGAIIHPTLMVRREAIEKAGRYREEANWIEDLDLYYRLSNIGKLANLDEFLLEYRVRPGSITYNKIEKKNEKKRWIVEQALIARGISPTEAGPILDRASPYTPPYEKHTDWAVTALDLSGWETSYKHALTALKMKPFRKRSWQTLKYVLAKKKQSKSTTSSS